MPELCSCSLLSVLVQLNLRDPGSSLGSQPADHPLGPHGGNPAPPPTFTLTLICGSYPSLSSLEPPAQHTERIMTRATENTLKH